MKNEKRRRSFCWRDTDHMPIIIIINLQERMEKKKKFVVVVNKSVKAFSFLCFWLLLKIV